MHAGSKICLLSLCLVMTSSACSGNDTLLSSTTFPPQEFGPNPALVDPDPGLIPTIKPAKAIGWPAGAQPVAAPGLTVNAFAKDLEHPRWLLALDNGDLLVAESRGPADAGGFSGIKGWFAKKMMAYAGAGGASPDRITLLRDTDSDGVADERHVLLTDLYSPIGMAVTNGYLYVANADALVRVPFEVGATAVSGAVETVVSLPGGPLNHHWTKNVIASEDGETLYVAVGSNSNIAENGLEAEQDRAAILAVDVATGSYALFASGLRNPVGMAWEPISGELWAAVNERDELGDQLVPDYITSVQSGGFYGWPYSYWGDHVDTRVEPQRPDLVARALKPDYAVGAHTASLGLAFYNSSAIPGFEGDALVGQHGSWNRNPRSGYKVIRIPFSNGKPSGMPEDVLTGFLSADGDAYGRPAGVVVDRSGAILVADDTGNTLWRVTADGL